MAIEVSKGGYRFKWVARADLPMGEAVCSAEIDGKPHYLFGIAMGFRLSDGPRPLDAALDQEMVWKIIVEYGKYRVVMLPSIGINADRDVVMMQAILAYKELGFGGGIPW